MNKEEEIVYIEVSKLKLNEKNPRKNDNAVDGVAKLSRNRVRNKIFEHYCKYLCEERF